MSLRFISDLHLEESRPEICRAFFSYLDNLPEDTEALYILGDFFEVWVGDDDDLAFHDSIKQKLKQKTAKGFPIYVMHGNRDFLLGKGFELQTGCVLISDPFVIHHNDKSYLLMHGDSLCTEDREYLAFRAQMRSTEMKAELLKKSLKERRELAKQLRQQSKTANSNKAEDIMDVTDSEVRSALARHQLTTLIHGHTHRPAIHDFTLNNQPRQRVVLGDWNHSGWEVVIDNNKITLNSFSISES